MPRAVVYCRVSTDDQVSSGAGLAAQRDSCVAWCERQGYEVVGPFEESEGVSGATPLEKRPGLMDAFATLAKGDVLLVAKRDRIARDRIMVAMLEGMLKRRKCRLVSAAGEGTEADDPNDPMAFMYRGMSDLFAEYERILISWRTRMGLQAKRRRNERTGRVPFGKALADDGRRSKRGGLPIALVDDAKHQRVLNEIFRLRRAGWTARRIAWALNHAGHRTPAGKPWQASSVHYLCLTHQVPKGQAPAHDQVDVDHTGPPQAADAPAPDARGPAA